jgi:ribosomal protein S18 acetylase RimI-like enzyme
MQTVELLPAVITDAEAIFNLTHRCFIAYAEKILKDGKIEALTETLDDVKRDIENKYVIKCVLDGEIVGSVRYEILDDDIAYLTRFGVAPEIQSLGLGSLLIEKVAGECAAKGVKAITLFTASKMTSSVAFYMKHGYYVHSITRDKGYIRAFLVKELLPMDELFDFEKVLK